MPVPEESFESSVATKEPSKFYDSVIGSFFRGTHEFINVLACEICNHVEDDIHHLHLDCQSVHRAEKITAKGKLKRIPRNLNTQRCPFYGETPGANNFVRHVSRHCEEIALSSLWQALDEVSESADSNEHSKTL